VVGVRLAAYLVDLIFPAVAVVLAVFAQAQVCLLRRELITPLPLAQVEQAEQGLNRLGRRVRRVVILFSVQLLHQAAAAAGLLAAVNFQGLTVVLVVVVIVPQHHLAQEQRNKVLMVVWVQATLAAAAVAQAQSVVMLLVLMVLAVQA
jgi:hypothetical protein